MATSFDHDLRLAAEAWDRLHRQLSAAPRRRILLALVRAPESESVSLPDAAVLGGDPDDRDRYRIELQHHHLPSLAEAGYVRWTTEPFRVRRGPRFEEAASIIRILLDSRDDLPDPLWNETVERTVCP